MRLSREEAIEALERLSMTRDEAERYLEANEVERLIITKAVQDRVKREQNKMCPMSPEEGPPLPRFLDFLRWPWKK